MPNKQIKKHVFIVAVFLFVQAILVGQNTFDIGYTGNFGMLFRSGETNNNSSYYTLGWTAVQPSRFLLMRTGIGGCKEMAKTYRPSVGGIGAHSYAYSGQQAFDDGYVLYGTCEAGSFGLTKKTLWIVKTSSTGTIQWSKTYAPGNSSLSIRSISSGPSGFDNTLDIRQTIDSGYVFSCAYDNNTIYLYKVDKAGALQWCKEYGALSSGGLVRQTKDFGYILGGAYQNDVVLIKVNSLGVVQWSNKYGDVVNSNYPLSIAETSDSGYAVCGFSNETGAINKYDLFVFKTNKAGTLQWEKDCGASGMDEFAKDIILDKNGDLVITGVANFDPAGWSTVKRKAYLAKLDINGNFYWERQIGSALESRGLSVMERSVGGYIMGSFETTTQNLKATDANGLIGCNELTVNLPKNSTFIRSVFNATATTQTVVEVDQKLLTAIGGDLLEKNVNCANGCILTVSLGVAICPGASATLTAGGTSCDFTWDPPTGLNSTSGKTVIASPTVTTTYTVTEADCGLTALITVSVVPLPVISVSSNTVICGGGSVVISASGATSYSWSPTPGIGSSTGSTITVNSTTLTTYTVFASSGIGCYDTGYVSVGVSPLPILAISADTIICKGDQSTLSVSGATNFLWSNLNTASTITVSPTVQTTYTVVGTNNVGCSSSAVVTVSVAALPSLTISGPSAICLGKSATIIAGGAPGYSYLWSNAATHIFITVSPTNTTSYTVTATTQIGCKDSVVHTVIVNPLPSLSVAGAEICYGNAVTITAGGSGQNYVWAGGLSFTNTISVSPTSTTSYTVTSTDGNNCSSTAIATVTVNPLPVLQTSPSLAICNGSQTTLTATGAANYLWSTSSTDSSLAVAPNATSNYSVTGTDAKGCSITSVITISVSPVPVAQISGALAICLGNNTTLSASGGTSYLWNNTTMGNVLTINPIVTTTYSVVASTGSCNDTDTYVVTVNPLPLVIVSPDTAICLGNSVTLSVIGSTANYLWSPVISNAATLNVSPIATTNYSVAATDANGCKNNAVVKVTVNSLPIASVSSNTTICAGSTTGLSASGGINYLWNNLSASSLINVAPLTSTTYSVIVTNNNGCTAVASVLVSVDQPPVPSVSNDTSVCEGQPIVLLASGGTSYSWSTGSLSPTIKINTHAGSTKYVVSVFKGVCEIKKSIFVNVFSLPIFNAGSNVTITKGSSIQLNATGGIGYNWSPPTGLSCVNCPDPIASPTETTTYYVTVTNETGCAATDSVVVNVDWICADLFIPNVFSPNADGQNDLFYVYGECVKEVAISIYNQWGERVFEDTGASPYWDGTFRGKELNSDVFAYNAKIILVTGEEISKVGNVTLLK